MPDISCILSAVLFVTGNVLTIVYLAKERNRSHYDFEDWSNLDTDYIEMDWDFRLANKALSNAGGWLNALAWAVFCFPILQLSWTLSYQGASTSLWIHVSIGILVLGVSLTEWMARLFWIGSQMASQQLIDNFNLDKWLRSDLATQFDDPNDQLGWLVLEINHIVSAGFIWFVDAFEWLGLAGIFTLVYFSVRQWRMQDTTSFGGCWNNMGLFLAVLCVMEFAAEILRFEGFKTFGAVAIIYAVVNRLILMPIWILTLAFALPRAQLKQQYYGDGNGNGVTGPPLTTTTSTTTTPPHELALTTEVEMIPAAAESSSPPAATFTIDDVPDYGDG